MQNPIKLYRQAVLLAVCAAICWLAYAQPAAAATNVQVSLSEYAITIDQTSIPAGDVNFLVTNNGTIAHSFVVSGMGVNASLPDVLQPGQQDTLNLTGLQPGSYTLYCPVDNHRALGMQTTLIVGNVSTEAGFIVFSRFENNRHRIFIVRPDGQDMRFLCDGFEPEFSRDGSRIVFVRDQDIFLIDFDGRNLRQLTHHQRGVFFENPSFDNDDQRIVFVTRSVGPHPVRHIRMIDVDGRNERDIVANGMDPVFSPDNRRIAFARGNQLLTVPAQGPVVTSSPMFNAGRNRMLSCPAFDPRGSGVAFCVRPSTQNRVDINMRPLNGQRQTRTLARNSQEPAFRPDGQRMAFSHNGQIWTMNPDGSHQQPVTRGTTNDSHPSWGMPRALRAR